MLHLQVDIESTKIQYQPLNAMLLMKGGYISRSFLQRQKVITSKSSSKNLSNVNKHTLCFQRIGIFIHFLSGKQQKLRFFDLFFDVIIVDR
jgi:hypothetical protein